MRLKDILSGFMLLQYIILFVFILFNYSGTVSITLQMSVGTATLNYPITFKFTEFVLATIITSIVAIILLNIGISALGIGGDKTPSTVSKVILLVVILAFLGVANLWALQILGTLGIMIMVLFTITNTFYIYSYAFSDTAEEI